MLIVHLRRVRHSPLYGVFSVHAGQYCLRGGEAIRGVGRGSCAGPAGPTQVPRGPRGLAGPFHQVARAHAGPRILEETRERV